MRRTLGLDVGTTALKGVLVNERGALVAEASRSYRRPSRRRGGPRTGGGPPLT